MEDDFIFFVNGRQPQLIFVNARRPNLFVNVRWPYLLLLEENLNCYVNGIWAQTLINVRWPHIGLKDDSKFLQMNDNLNLLLQMNDSLNVFKKKCRRNRATEKVGGRNVSTNGDESRYR